MSEEKNITIVANVNQEVLGEGLLQTTITGFIDIDEAIPVSGGRIIRVEKVLPFSVISIVEETAG